MTHEDLDSAPGMEGFAELMKELQDLLVECPAEQRGGLLHGSMKQLNTQMHDMMAEHARLRAEEGDEAATLMAMAQLPALMLALAPAAVELDEADDEDGPSAKDELASLLKVLLNSEGPATDDPDMGRKLAAAIKRMQDL
jgi:hypothetical protein